MDRRPQITCDIRAARRQSSARRPPPYLPAFGLLKREGWHSVLLRYGNCDGGACIQSHPTLCSCFVRMPPQDRAMARSTAAVKPPPAPNSSWPSSPVPAGGFGRRPARETRPAAADPAAPIDADVAVDGDRRRGRGAQSNASGRYEPLARIAFDDGWQSFEELPPFKTTVTVDSTRKIITRNDSPDISFDRSINPYRGCEHGCIYCFARPTHAYLGLSPGLDFESKLFVKPQAAKLLTAELASPKYRPDVVAMGTNTDPYQPVERDLKITRSIIRVLSDFNNPVGIVTKSALVVRDLDILARMAERNLVKVAISVTTLDAKLARTMEPRASTPQRRLDALRQLVKV